MKLLKSTDKTNIGNIDKIYIIKDIYVLAFPESNEIMQSEIILSDEKNFEEISITDGTLEIKDDDKGNGNIFNFKVNFRHPKVRVDADNFFNKYRSKLVRLIVTDKNNLSYFTPKGFLKIKQSIPAIPAYSGYTVEFTGTCETLQSVTLDGNYTPPANWIYLDKAYHPSDEINETPEYGLIFLNLGSNFYNALEGILYYVSETENFYTGGTSYYLAPESGIYKFHIRIKIELLSPNPDDVYLKFWRRSWNTQGDVIFEVMKSIRLYIGINTIDEYFTCNLNQGNGIFPRTVSDWYKVKYNYIETFEQFLSVSKLE